MTKQTAILNAKIYTDWYSQPSEAILIENGLIKQTGSTQAILSSLPSDSEKFDMQGMIIWPGLCDAHLHLEQLAKQLSAINCEGLSKEEILDKVHQKAHSLAPGEWIIGFGFNQNDWSPPEYGNSRELDAVSPHHPVMLHAKSLHAAWVNSHVMQIAGIHAQSPDPNSGAFLRYKDGSPNGILLEQAIECVAKHIPPISPQQMAKDLLQTQSYLHSLGITSVHDFDGLTMAEALLKINAEQSLSLRVMKNMRFNNFDLLTREDYRATLNDGEFLHAGWLKLFADGALGPQSAAMLAPYKNSTNRGMLLMSVDEMAEIGIQAARRGWSLSIHAIGDLATRSSLDAIEKIQQATQTQNIKQQLPHRVEHIQALDPSDLNRFSALGVVASIQPIHACSDFLTAERLWGARCKHAYAYKSLLESGAELFLGTDAPVELANPFHTLYAAVTRQTLQGEPKPDGWYPAQRLSLKETLIGMTVSPARYFGTAAQTGKLTPGSNADFIVLKNDPFCLPATEIATIKPLMTFVAGKQVYCA